MWAFFALENVSSGACSQLDAIICSDSQKKKAEELSTLHCFGSRARTHTHTIKKGYSIMTVDSSISDVIFTSNQKETSNGHNPTDSGENALFTGIFKKSMWVFLSFSLFSLTNAWIKGSAFLLECKALSSLRFVLAKSFSKFHNWTQKIQPSYLVCSFPSLLSQFNHVQGILP